MWKILFGTKQIEWEIEYRERKTLAIKVFPDCTIKVIAPIGTHEREIRNKVKLKAGWIIKQQNYFRSFQPATTTRLYVSGETHLYMGRQYKLKILKENTHGIRLYRGIFEISTPNTSALSVEILLTEWYKQKARTLLSELYDEVLLRYPKFYKKNPTLRIQKMSNRWGSCTKSGKIIINSELIKAPKACIEYIIIHELCHLLYPNHNKSFFNYLSTLLPDWEKLKERLERVLN